MYNKQYFFLFCGYVRFYKKVLMEKNIHRLFRTRYFLNGRSESVHRDKQLDLAKIAPVQKKIWSFLQKKKSPFYIKPYLVRESMRGKILTPRVVLESNRFYQKPFLFARDLEGNA